MSKYQKVSELIHLWEEYEAKEGNDDFANFGVWLHNRHGVEKFSERSLEANDFSRENNFQGAIRVL